MAFASSYQRRPGKQAHMWDGFGKALGWGGHQKSALSQGDDSRRRPTSFFTPQHEIIRNDKTYRTNHVKICISEEAQL